MGKAKTKQLCKVLYTFLFSILLLGNKTVAFAATEAAYESDVKRGEGKVFRGVVNMDDLNVRKAAGRNNPQLQADGKNVTLNKYDEVAILDKTLSSKETWYKVSFRRDGSLIVGYVHSYYVDLTKDVITPLPDSSSASSNPATYSQAEESSTSIWLWIAIGAGVVIAAALILYIKDRSSSHSYRSSYSGTSYSSSSSSGSYSNSYLDSPLWDSPSNYYNTNEWKSLNDDLDLINHMHEEYGEDWLKDM